MARAVKLGRIEDALATLEYPVDRERAVDALSDVTLLLADGEENLGDVVAACRSDSFESMPDLELAIYEYLPVAALGEVGEGDP